MPKRSEKIPREYTKPVFRRVFGLDFILRTIRATWHRVACRQCSSCHTCR